MPNISISDRAKMDRAFDLDVAKFLAGLAMQHQTITYGALGKQFDRIARGWGNTLGGIAIRCHKAGYPLLPVVVVNAETGLPSVDALLYEDLGLSKEQQESEQERCFTFDWSKTPLAPT